MKLKITKSTTNYYCYDYTVFYDCDDKSYTIEYGISEEINKILKHKRNHRRSSYFIDDGRKVYYKDSYDFIYKLYHNMDIMIVNTKYGSELSVFVDK